MTKARDIASATTPNANAALLATFPHRNIIINGAMQVAQRGTSYSQSPNSGNYHTVDRFSYRRTGAWSGVTAVALSQESSGAPSGFTHFLRYAPTGSDSSTPSDTSMYIDAKLEGNSVSSLALGTSAAKSFTISFYVRSSVTGTFCISVQNGEPTLTKRSYVAEYTIDSANTWEQKELTVDAPTSGTFATDTSIGLALAFIVSADSSSSTYSTSTVGSWLSSTDVRWSSNQSDVVTTSANQTFDITGIQLELGDTATPFEHRSYGDELARCQRYFEKSYSDSTAPGTITITGVIRFRAASSSVEFPLSFLVKKRSAPTVTLYSYATGASGNIRDISAGSDGAAAVASIGEIWCFPSKNTSGSDGNQYAIHFTADAEL